MGRRATKGGPRSHRKTGAEVETVLRAALVEHRAGRFEAAERAYRTALDLAPGEPAAAHGLGLVLAERGALDEGVVWLERAARAASGDPRVWNNLGGALREAGRLEEAVRAYRRALARDPRHVGARYNLGVTLQDLGDLEGAQDCYRAVLEAAPEDAEAWHALGTVLEGRAAPAEAEAAYRRSIALVPGLAEGWYNLGNVVKAQGRSEEALEAYRRALEGRSDYAEACHNLGGLLLELGRAEEAIAHLERAAELRPGHAESARSLAAACFAAGRFEAARAAAEMVARLRPEDPPAQVALAEACFALEAYRAAEAAFRRAVELEPGDAAAHAGLGRTLVRLYRIEEAEDACRRALELDPRSAEAHVALGVALKFRQRLTEAIAAYERAIELDPANAAAHNNLGLAYLDAGDLERAERCYRRALEVNPEMPEVLVNLTHMRRFTDEDREPVALLERLLERPALAGETRAAVHFALGKVHDDLGRPERAFGHYRQGNALKAQRLRWNGDGHEAMVGRVMTTYSAPLFRELEGVGEPSRLPVFIVGMPRSGTTLVEQILASHPAVHGAGELTSVGELAQRLAAALGADYPECVRGLDAATARRLAGEHLSFLRGLGGDAPRVTDKLPANYLHLGLIAVLFPGARVIHCRRDARDTVLSNFFQSFGQGQHWSYRLEDIARYYRIYHRLMAHWREVLPLRIHELSYERLVADQEAESRALIAFLGLEWDTRCLAFHETRRAVQTASHWQVRQPLYARSAERWRRYERHLPAEVLALAEEEAGT